MSHPDARLDIHPPTFETTVAAQITVNVLCRYGAHAEVAIGGAAVAGGSVLAVGTPITINQA
jgi:hypothetical protein